MEIYRVSRPQAAEARGVVIVIDVIRAFTVAAYAFAGGARNLWLVRRVEETFALCEREPGALLAGEVGGRLIPGFDFKNSLARIATADVLGRLLIQRTGAGTQGALAVANATHLLLCSLVNARATATYAGTLAETTGGIVTLHPTGEHLDIEGPGEDMVCADYVEALLRGREDAQETLAKDIARLQAAGRFELWRQDDPDFPQEDIPAVLDVDRFGFAMVGTRKQWSEITYVEVEKVE